VEIKEDGWYDGLGSRFVVHFYKKGKEAKSRCGQINKEIVAKRRLDSLFLIPETKKKLQEKKCGSCVMLMNGEIDEEIYNEKFRY
jgi:hypothetical protein